MITQVRLSLSGQVVLAATVLLTSTSAAASPSTVSTDTSASPALVTPARLSMHTLGASTTRGEPDGDALGDTRPSTAAPSGLETLPERVVTSLAEARIVGQKAALVELYKTLTSAVAARGFRVTRFVLAGEALADAPSEDVVLEVYVAGLDGDESRIHLWEALTELTVTASFDAEFWNRFALVVYRTRH
jgi:hypothetical protein